MSKVMKWKYKGKPDIVFGEIKESKAPKIILFSIIGLIACICIIGFLFRNYLYDLVFNPHIEFNNLVKVENGEYFIDLDLNSEFDKNAYIDSARTLKYDKFISDNNKYVCEVFGELNTKIIGEYEIIYSSSNRIKSQEVPVTVRISDNEDPIVELTQNTETISCIDEAIKSFNPEDYVKLTTDNYYDVSLEIRITNNITGLEVSLNDIQNLYYDISDLDNIYSGDTETEEGLSDWIDAYTNIATKYSEIDIDPEKQYLIEYIVTENSDAKRSAQTELLLTVEFDKNSIIKIINTEHDKLQAAVDKFNEEHPNTVVTTKPSNGNNNNNGNTGNNNGNTGENNDKPAGNSGTTDRSAKCPWCDYVGVNADDVNAHIRSAHTPD